MATECGRKRTAACLDRLLRTSCERHHAFAPCIALQHPCILTGPFYFFLLVDTPIN